jgi:hypothetical protein
LWTFFTPATRRGGGRLKILRVARHGAVQPHIPVHIHNGHVGRVDQRIEGQFRLNRLADVLGLAILGR